MWILSGANVALLAVVAMLLVGVIAMFYRPEILDFMKANFGLLVLTLLFMTLLAISFHVFHLGSTNALAKDFLAWLEQKAGEVLASVMTVIVGARATNQRATDTTPSTNGTGTTPAPVTRTTVSTTTVGIPPTVVSSPPPQAHP